ILGVNHFLDMCRTALNVTGDLALTTLVAKGETEEPSPATAGRVTGD
ncbi:cation:dicarboxylase symporter family transporter, partial [Stenotrophomonas sp.]